MRRCRLIYRSVAAAEAMTPEGLRGILEQARVNNERLGIDGLLLLSGGQFLQVLEGPVPFVNELYARIIGDSRHRDVQLVSYEMAGTPYFYDWRMEVVELGGLSSGAREMLERKYDMVDGSIVIPEDLFHVYALLLDARSLSGRKA